jgi:hypothetical protein
MKRVLSVFVMVFGLVSAVRAQDQNETLCRLTEPLYRLKAQATEVTDINLDPNMLRLASGVMSKDKSGEDEIKKMLSSIKGVCVRSYKFDKAIPNLDKYMDMMRVQFSDSSWSSMVKVRNQKTGENVDVLFQMKNGAYSGLAIVAAKPQEFTFVRIDGGIDLAQLAKLGGSFGIPKLNMAGQSNPEPKPEPKLESK